MAQQTLRGDAANERDSETAASRRRLKLGVQVNNRPQRGRLGSNPCKEVSRKYKSLF